MRVWIATVMMLAAGTEAVAQAPVSTDWRRLATPRDRARLRVWRVAWSEGLAAAQRDPRGAARIAGDPALFDPDRTLSNAMPPAGPYDCRIVKLGRQGGVGAVFATQEWMRCRIDDRAGVRRFATLGGRQGIGGSLHGDTDARAVFLGAMTLADERPMAYGQDAGRDMAGLMERIGPQRWRLVLPRPAYQSVLDVIDLRPPDQGAATDNAGKVAR